MKHTLILFFAFLLAALTACGGEKPSTDEGFPADLGAKRELLKTKRAELRQLNKYIEDLEVAMSAQDPDYAPKASLVTADTLALGNFKDYGTLQATVKAAETAYASAELAGRLLRVTVEDGAQVRRGQLLATLNVEDIQNQKAELEKAAELAKTVYERQQKLWDQKIGSEIQYLEAKNSYERLQKSLGSFDTQLGKRNVYAPISGTVEMVNLRAGEIAVPGAPIVTIVSTGKLKVVADAPEEFLTKVKPGQRVEISVPSLGESFVAPVSRIGRTVDAATALLRLKQQFPLPLQTS
ncbi:MAG: efflux RND transporter periplasmic adaptor subunit [Lewinella sp.]|nr:efflux RND transporter periplasmic adaptor subunit [Lewinella sp.]